jgi:Tol biopolymer transport system component
MLLLLLLISSGCDVNIPGCGKRSLPFFKPVNLPPVPSNPVTVAGSPVSAIAPSASATKAQKPPQNQTGGKKPGLIEVPVEMNISKPKPTATGTPSFTPTPQEVEKIAFTTLEHDKPILWTMGTDGADRNRLTPIGTSSWFPLWSPNGKWLAFLSDMKNGKMNLYVIEKDGSNLKQLTSFDDMAIPNSSHLKPPFSWSPKSDEIAFCYQNQVWKANLDTLELQTLATEDPNFTVSALEWAPHRDNKYVAYVVTQGENYTILMLVNPRLLDTLKLAATQNPIMDISWTSDARDVAYLIGQNALYTASSQTSLPKMILNHPCPELGPLVAYSPSEAGINLLLLAKEFSTDQDYRVALLDKPSTGYPDTGSLKYLTEAGVSNAIWSPDGSQIAYLQSGDLWVMDVTGAHKHRIALIGVQSPCWSKK